MIPAFLKVKEETVYYSGENELLFFVPEIFFDRKVAIIDGVYVELLGILNYAVNVKPDTTISPKNIRRFYFPSRFVTKPGRIEKVKNFALTPNYTADFRIFHYTNNGEDEVIVSTKVPQNIDNVEDLFRLFVDTGHIPKSISYDNLYEYLIDSMTINGGSYKLQAQLFGVLVSELCRDPQDINKPFRLGTAIDKDRYSYTPISIKEVPRLVSPFTSITSENFDNAVVSAIMNQNNTPTPLEKILTG